MQYRHYSELDRAAREFKLSPRSGGRRANESLFLDLSYNLSVHACSGIQQGEFDIYNFVRVYGCVYRKIFSTRFILSPDNASSISKYMQIYWIDVGKHLLSK